MPKLIGKPWFENGPGDSRSGHRARGFCSLMFLSILCGVVVMILGPARQWWARGNLWVLRRRQAQFCTSPWRNGVRARSGLQVCTLTKGKRGSSHQRLVSFALWRRENGVRALDAFGVLCSCEGKAGFEPLAACETSTLARGKRGSSLKLQSFVCAC